MALQSIEPVNEIFAPNETRSLYIVDDETELLAALGESLRTLGFTPRTFERPDTFLAAIREDEIGCIITDLRMPGMGGIDLLKQLNERESCLAVILLTAFADVPTAVDVMKLGAVSVIEKPFDLSFLADEIHAAMQVSQELFNKRALLRSAKAKLESLSSDEIAVLDLAIEGRPNREIAETLAISPRTVDRRRHSALQKLNAESVAEYAVLKTRVGST